MKVKKRYYCDGPVDKRGYGIFDLSKADRTRDEFVDDDGDICGWMFHNYLVDETDSMMTGEEVTDTLNRLGRENAQLDFDLFRHKVFCEQMNLQTGSLAYMKILVALHFKDILYLEKDESGQATIKAYVKPEADENELNKFRDYLPLGATCRFFIITDGLLEEVELK